VDSWEKKNKGGAMLNWEKYAVLANRFLRLHVLINDIPRVDIEDIRQNIVLHILKHQKSVAVLSRQQLADFIDQAVEQSTKRWKRYRSRYLSMEDEQTPTVNETRQGEFNENGFVLFKLDVATILAKLTPRQRVICHNLIHDKLPYQIQQQVQCSLTTLELELDKIRRRFRKFDYC
jgi:hypothetical protein